MYHISFAFWCVIAIAAAIVLFVLGVIAVLAIKLLINNPHFWESSRTEPRIEDLPLAERNKCCARMQAKLPPFPKK